MSKKSKKRKRRESSSSSEDNKASPQKYVSKSGTSVHRKEDSRRKEEKSKSFQTKHDSRSSRPIKKPVYRLEKRTSSDQKSHDKTKSHTKTESVSVSSYGGSCSDKETTRHNSRKDKAVIKNETVQKRSKCPDATDAAAQKNAKKSQSSQDENSLTTSCKTPISHSFVPAEQKKHRQDRESKKCKAEEVRTKTTSIESSGPSRTLPPLQDSFVMERTKLVTKMCQRHRDDVKNRLVKINETYSASLKKHTLCAPTEHTTLDRSKNMLKNFDSLPKSFIPLSEKTASPSLAKDKSDSLGTHLRFSFKIPKKVKPKPLERPNSSAKNCIVQTPKVSESGTKISKCETRTRQESLNVSPSFSTERKDKSSSLSEQIPSVIETIPESTSDQMQVVEELHLARTEKKLEVDVLQSCGELTCMEIDPPEEEASKQSSQQDLILVLDTNILLSHLDYVKKIKSQGLGALGSPVVLIPWVVLQELDSLKKGKGLSGSVAHLAIPAISYIYNSLKNREVNLWGQSMQQASESSNCLTAENNDDRVLQCCLQYQSLYPECAVILCTNDKNLCSKAFLSGVKALSKKDLETETWRTSNGLWLLQNIQTPVLPHTDSQSSSSMLSRSFTPAQPPIQERADLSVGLELKYDHQLTSKEAEEVKAEWDLGRCLSELKDNLKEVLSDVLQVEMKAVYEELWLEIVYLKPPWTLQDVLQCLKKHWIAVFGQIVPRKKLQIVLYLIDFFNSGKTADRAATLTALQEARELVKVFANRSSLVPSAIVKIDKMIKSVEPQGEPHLNSCDVVMNDEDEDRQLIQTQVTHQEVWAMFENLWCHVYQLSLEVFKVLGFDSNTMQSLQTAGCSQPPQDAMACLHKLSSMVSQLLQAFSSVLSLDLCLDKVQDLFSIIHSNKIIAVDSRLTATDLLHCFAQHEYREKLGVGGTQLLWLKEALDRCAGAMGQNTTFTTQPEWNNADTSAHQQNRSL